MDKGGIQIGHLDRGYLPHPTSMRKVIQDWSIRRTDRSRGYMQPYRELGNELDKNYDYERILSTSRGSSGSSGSITERISAILYSFVGHVREARELGRAYLHVLDARASHACPGTSASMALEPKTRRKETSYKD